MAFGPFGFLFRRAGAFFLRALVRRPALQGGVPHLRRVPGQGGLHAGVLHRGRPLAHRQDARAAPGHAALGRRGLPRQRPPRSASSCRSRSPTSGSSKRARWSSELEGGAKKQESMLGLMRARKLPAAPLRQRVRELRRADLAGDGARRSARELRGRRRRGAGRAREPSSSSSATRSSSASTGAMVATRPASRPARCSASAAAACSAPSWRSACSRSSTCCASRRAAHAGARARRGRLLGVDRVAAARAT